MPEGSGADEECFSIGDAVKVRDEGYSDWHSGYVACTSPLRVKVSFLDQPKSWHEVLHDQMSLGDDCLPLTAATVESNLVWLGESSLPAPAATAESTLASLGSKGGHPVLSISPILQNIVFFVKEECLRELPRPLPRCQDLHKDNFRVPATSAE